MPIAYAIGGGRNIGGSTVRLHWTGEQWESDWALPFNCGTLYPVPTTATTQTLMWKVAAESVIEPNKSDLVWADVDEFGLIAPDTLAQVWASMSEYAAAVTPKRRWAAASDYTNLRFFVKTGDSRTEELEVPDQADKGLAIAPLDDWNALVVWGSEYFGFRWAVAGDAWVPGGAVPNTYWSSDRPRLRKRPSGGLWMGWGQEDKTVVLGSYNEGKWGPVREFDSSMGDGDYYHRSLSLDLSRDDREWPAIAWCRVYDLTAGEEICVAIPDAAGNYSQQVIENSGGGWLPTILRDRYGDVWLGWFVFSDASYWTHTYTAALPLQPSIVRGARSVLLSCPLTTASPGSHWTVLRSSGAADPDSVGIVVAASDSILQWTDASVSPDMSYHYQVRRDCVDSRYIAFSPTAEAPALILPKFAIRVSSQDSRANRLSLLIRGAAAGPVRIQVFDVSGRRVASGSVENQGGPYEEQSAVVNVERALRRGIYFARATDRTGATSEAARTVLLQ